MENISDLDLVLHGTTSPGYEVRPRVRRPVRGDTPMNGKPINAYPHGHGDLAEGEPVAYPHGHGDLAEGEPVAYPHGHTTPPPMYAELESAARQSISKTPSIAAEGRLRLIRAIDALDDVR